MSDAIIRTDSTRFASDVIAASRRLPVLVDFWASWCAPCVALAPVLERLAAELEGQLAIVKVDVDSEPELAARYGVRAMPTLKLFRHGEVVQEAVGLQPPSVLRAMVDPFLRQPGDDALERGRSALAAGDAAAAITLLRDAAARAPEHWPLQVELATALLANGDASGADAIVRSLPANVAEDPASRALRARVEFATAAADAPAAAALQARVVTNPDDLEARYLLGARHIATGAYEEGLAQMFEIMKRDRAFRDDLGRRSLVSAFEIIGSDSDLAKHYRAEMAGLLY